MKTLSLLSLGASLLLFAPLLAPARAQVHPPPGSGFTWERVGNIGIDADALAFGPDSLGRPGRYILWAAGNEGIYRYDDSVSPPLGRWVILQPDPRYQQSADEILPLGPDTLLVVRTEAFRSTDGGYTFELVSGDFHNGHAALAEIPPGVPNAGRLLLGDYAGYPSASDSKYSDDRGATWTRSAVPPRNANVDIVVLPAGSPWAGRVVAAANPGIMLSDDGGASYNWGSESAGSLLLALTEQPDLSEWPRVVSAGGTWTWWSDDGGETWEGRETSPGLTSARHLLSLGGPSLLKIHYRGEVQRSDDGGETWETLGRAPVEDEGNVSAKSAVLGPDGRLYVGVLRPGPDDEWVYRTEERLVPVAAEPSPEAPSGLRLDVSPNPAQGEAEVSLVLARPGMASVALYDGLGRRVAVLHEGTLTAGRHVIPFYGADLPAGVYVVRAAVEGESVAEHLTLAR
ncbi:MAG: hypothetical protein R3181_02725 [Rubricoccaceae bacterium]|nr:hypothetical protein [Rubricoccaceae bacterium]